ncbi:DsrE/DsrF/DrsH-like family protein [Ammoniphilus resinae]|uniref:Peroxiredoxin family protein n=1 Tax=Ammoniphilus resinae TaxID=861532 RepID=A0ABS4GRE0_9BACL|nr:DsrE/DsrF/DrsH-like family protein [Ammoniphilus resinae]MBP1932799.1 peroxiredoxin family protein [Ammoniphilus resinae]
MENQKEKTTIILFSGDLDKAIAAFIIANGAAAFDHEVTIFTTFWGLNVLRRDQQVPVKKGLLEKAFGWMMPRGPGKLALSKMNMAGMGPKMIKHVMKKHNALSLPQLMEMAQEQGVKLVGCTMTMELLGIQKEELIDGVELAGVAAYLGDASNAKVNLFI